MKSYASQTTLQISLRLGILLILASLFWVGCQKNDFPTLEPVNVKKLSQNLLADYAEGEVCIKTTQKQQILVSFRSKNQSLVTQVYVLQLDKDQPIRTFHITLPKAEVVYAKEGLLIADTWQKQYFFLGVANPAGNNILQNIETNMRSKLENVYKGFGLSAMRGSWNMKNEDKVEGAFAYILEKKVSRDESQTPTTTFQITNDPDDPKAGTATCASGGVGSTSCSNGAGGVSCSVSCGAGFYACCNVVSCYCVANP